MRTHKTLTVWAIGLGLCQSVGATSTQDIQDACPRVWEPFYNEFVYTTGMHPWSDGLPDKAEFVRYASDAIFVYSPGLSIDGSSQLRTYTDVVEIARHCGAHHENYYQWLKGTAQVLLNAITVAGNNDSDGDGVNDAVDICPSTVSGHTVTIQGCAATQEVGGNYADSDGDGLYDYLDAYPLQMNGTQCPS